MTVTSVSSATSTGFSVTSGNTLDVLNAGTIIATEVSSGGIENVSAGGTASGSIVNSGGYENVSSGGTAIDTQALDGGYQRVFAQGTASGTVVSSGSYQVVSSGGRAIGALAAGGYQVVSSGGAATNTMVGSGGKEVVSAGGTVTGTTVRAGGFEYVSGGGIASNTVVSSGGYAIVSSGGTAVSTTVSAGGFQVVSAGGSAVDAMVSSGGQEQVASGGTDIDTTVSAGGYEYVSSGGTASGSLLSTGGFEIVSAGGTIVGATINGGTLEILSSGATDTGTITFDDPGRLTIVAGTPAFIVAGFKAGDSIDFRAVGPTVTSASLTSSGGDTLLNGVTFAGTLSESGPGSLRFDADGLGGTLVTIACFAAGTRILTDRGELAVEDLREGDRVATLHGERLARVRWIGYRRLAPARLTRPYDAFPLRIAANAFGPGMPHRELLLSPEHAVHVDGALIPIHHLVNGMSIVRDEVAEITYFHVELDEHDVLLANGLPCESYLDTGNRYAFANGGAFTRLDADFVQRAWETLGCARLVLEGEELERVRQRILAQAGRLGFELTDDPALHLSVAGSSVWPTLTAEGTWRFALPPAAREARLRSRASVPAEVLAGADDKRRLGVPLARILLDGREIALDDARLRSGFHPVEPGWRWTDGDAVLMLGRDGASELEIVVPFTTRYVQGSGAGGQGSGRAARPSS